MKISELTQEEIEFLEKSIKIGRSKDKLNMNKLVLTEIQSDLEGSFLGDHVGDHVGDHYGDHEGDHFGVHRDIPR